MKLRKDGLTMEAIGAELGVKATAYLAKKIKATYGPDALAKPAAQTTPARAREARERGAEPAEPRQDRRRAGPAEARDREGRVMPGYVRNRGKRADGSTRWEARWRHPTTQERRERSFRTRALADRWIKTMDADALRRRVHRPAPQRQAVQRGRRRLAAVVDRVGAEDARRLRDNLGNAPAAGVREAPRLDHHARARRGVHTAAVRRRDGRRDRPIGVRRAPRRPQHGRPAADDPGQRLHRREASAPDASRDVVPQRRRGRRPRRRDRPALQGLHLHGGLHGLARRELGALRRSDVDLLRGRLAVNQALKDLSSARLPEAERGLSFGPTKTHARRTVTLPAFLAKMLDEHLKSRPPETDALVFTMPEGGPVRHTNFYRRYFRPAVDGVPARPARKVRRGLPSADGKPVYRTIPAQEAIPGCLPAAKAGIRFHDLRHTCAALLIGAGAHPKAIQERLGHKSITMTLDRYGHLLPGLGDALAVALDAAHTAAQAPPDNVRELRPAAEG